MKKIIILFLSISLLLLVSCSDSNSVESRLFIVSLALNYGESNSSRLYGTLNDQRDLIDQFIILSENYDKKTSIYQLTEDYNNYTVSYMNWTNDYARSNVVRGTKDDGSTRLTFYYDLEEIFSTLQNEITVNDTIIFLYSGHGALSANGVEDEITGCLAIGTDSEDVMYLRPSTLTRLIGEIDCNRVVILDSCYSAKIFNGNEYNQANEIEEAYFDFSDCTKNTAFWGLAASSKDEVSYESRDLGHGFFSYALAKALGYGADTEITEKRISVSSIFRNTFDEFQKIWAEEVNGRVTQNLRSTANYYDLVLFD